MKKINIYEMTTVAIFTALLCVVGPLTIPIGAVPITLVNFVLCVAVCLLGTKLAAISLTLYIIIGAIGVPVFSGMTGGLVKLIGPTGGYIIGYYFVILLGGLFIHLFKNNYILTGVGLILGTALLYLAGTVWFSFLLQYEFAYSLTLCVYPFIIPDLIKIVLAIPISVVLKKALNKAGFLKAK